MFFGFKTQLVLYVSRPNEYPLGVCTLRSTTNPRIRSSHSLYNTDDVLTRPLRTIWLVLSV